MTIFAVRKIIIEKKCVANPFCDFFIEKIDSWMLKLFFKLKSHSWGSTRSYRNKKPLPDACDLEMS